MLPHVSISTCWNLPVLESLTHGHVPCALSSLSALAGVHTVQTDQWCVCHIVLLWSCDHESPDWTLSPPGPQFMCVSHPLWSGRCREIQVHSDILCFVVLSQDFLLWGEMNVFIVQSYFYLGLCFLVAKSTITNTFTNQVNRCGRGNGFPSLFHCGECMKGNDQEKGEAKGWTVCV